MKEYLINYKGNSKTEFKNFIRILTETNNLCRKSGWWSVKENCLAKILLAVSEASVEYHENIDLDQFVGAELKLSLFPYQKEVVSFCLEKQKGVIVLPCGSGKTPIGIDLFIDAKRAGLLSADAKGLIVVKSSLKVQWSKEVSKFSDLKAGLVDTYKSIAPYKQGQISKLLKQQKLLLVDAVSNFNEICENEEKIKQYQETIDEEFRAMFYNDADLYIANYETLRDEKVRRMLRKQKLEYIMADEIHYIKNDASARSKALCEFADVKMRFGSTATPIQKNPLDAYSIVKFISPGTFKSKSSFASRYIVYSGFGRISGSKNEKELNSKLSDFMIVKKKEEVSSQLPTLMVVPRYCKLSPKQLKITEQLLEEIKSLKEEEQELMKRCNGNPIPGSETGEAILKVQANIMARQTFASELADSEELLADSDSELASKYVTGSKSNKIEMLLDLLEEIIESGEKSIIFSKYRRLQPILGKAIKSKFPDVEIAFVNGSMSSEDRYREVYEKFRDTENCRILIMSDAGAEGINASTSKYLIEMEPADSYLIQTQRRGRIERADSIHDNVIVYQLIAEESYDEIGLKIIEKKEKYDAEIIKGEI